MEVSRSLRGFYKAITIESEATVCVAQAVQVPTVLLLINVVVKEILYIKLTFL